MSLNKSELLNKLRNKQKENNKSFRDDTRWIPDKVKDGEEATYKIYILPPLNEGDKCLGKDNKKSVCASGWDDWNVKHGHHFINKTRLECPRAHETGDRCPLCDIGFELMKEFGNSDDDKKRKRAIADEWLSRPNKTVNVYFLDIKTNPENLRGQVRYWSLPSKVVKLCEDCLAREDAGDDEDELKPFGLFCDPENAFAINVKVFHKGGWNNYDESTMVSKSRAIADDEDAIQDILNKRVDIATKFAPVDLDKLQKIAESKLGSSTGDDFDDAPGNKQVDDKAESSNKTKAKVESKSEESKTKSSKAKTDDDDELESKSKSKSKSEDDDDESESKAKAKSKAKSEDDDDKVESGDDEGDEEVRRMIEMLGGN